MSTKMKSENLLSKVLGNANGVFSLCVISSFILFGIIVPFLSPWDPNEPNIYISLGLPDTQHWFGTDTAGRDVFTRLAVATRYSLATASVAVLVSMIVGVPTGLIAGYFGRWFDSLASWATAIVMALPGLVVLLAAIAVIGPSMWYSMAIFGVLMSPAYFRLVYVAVRGVRNELYVDAARVSGLSDFRIISRHVLGVIRAPIIIQTAIVASIAIAIQSGIEFLGLGDKNSPSWGAMLNDAFRQIYQAPVLLIWPSVAVSLISIALVVFANTLRDELERTEPKKEKRNNKPSDSGSNVQEQPPNTIIHPDSERDSKTPLLSISNLAVGYSDGHGGVKKVVRNTTLSVNKGEVVGLIGESGSGKTQTAFALLGLLPAGGKVVAGSIIFDGQDLAKISTRDLEKIRGARISYIPQEPMSNLDPSFTIGSQIVEPMIHVLKISKQEAIVRAIKLLGRVGIPDPSKAMKKYPHEISGGQAQRVLIAGAVSCNPDLIIADEPTTALDVTVQAEVLDLLRELQQETNTALLLVTHNFGVVADLCDYINVMQSGSIVEAGNVIEIFNNATHPYTRSLLEAILEGGPARGKYEARKELQ